MHPRATLIALVTAISLVLSLTAAGSPGPARPAWMPTGPGVLSTASASAKALEAAGMKNLGTIWARPAKAPKTHDGVIENIVEGVIGGQIVLIFQYVSQHPEIFKEFKEWVLKKIGSGYTLYRNSGDGECPGSWSLDTYDHLGSCKSKHGIFWETYGTGTWWDTYTRGALIARSTSNRAEIFTNRTKEDWYTWSFYQIKSSQCGSNDFCGDTMVLRNHSSSGVSDTAS